MNNNDNLGNRDQQFMKGIDHIDGSFLTFEQMNEEEKKQFLANNGSLGKLDLPQLHGDQQFMKDIDHIDGSFLTFEQMDEEEKKRFLANSGSIGNIDLPQLHEIGSDFLKNNERLGELELQPLSEETTYTEDEPHKGGR